jgi:hypothetical protein
MHSGVQNVELLQGPLDLIILGDWYEVIGVVRELGAGAPTQFDQMHMPIRRT